MRVTIDSSVILRRLIPQEVGHAEAFAFMKDVSDWRHMADCPLLVLAEVAGRFRRHVGEIEAREAVESLRSIHSIRWGREMPARTPQVAIDGALKGADALIVAYAIEKGTLLVTTDGPMLEGAARVGLDARPPEKVEAG